MQTYDFLKECNSAMGFHEEKEVSDLMENELDIMDLFEESSEKTSGLTDDLFDQLLEDEDVEKTSKDVVYALENFSTVSTEISPEFNPKAYINSLAPLTPLEEDYVYFISQLVNSITKTPVAASFDAFIAHEYENIYKDRKFPGKEEALYEYCRNRYLANISFEIFKTVADQPLGFLHLLAFPYREAEEQDVKIILENYKNSAFNITDVWNFSFVPEDTIHICSLQAKCKFDRDEIKTFSHEQEPIHFYLQLKDAGIYNHDDYKKYVELGSYAIYATGMLAGNTEITNVICKRKDCKECIEYLGTVPITCITKYKDAAYLGKILKFIHLYGEHEDFINRFFVTENGLGLHLDSYLDDAHFMQTIIENPMEYIYFLLRELCSGIRLNITACEFDDSFLMKLFDSLYLGHITKWDVALYIIISQQNNELADQLKTTDFFDSCECFIWNYICSLMDISRVELPERSTPVMYQFRFRSSSLVVNIYELINHFDFYSERIKKYVATSSVIRYGKIQNIGCCFSFGRDTSSYKKLQETDKPYHCSLHAWLERLSEHEEFLTPRDVLRFNTILLQKAKIENSLVETVGKFCKVLRNVDANKFVGYDLIFNFLYHNPKYCILMSQKRFAEVVRSLQNAILMDNSSDMSFIFLYNLFSRLLNMKVQISSVPVILTKEERIFIECNQRTIANYESLYNFIRYFDSTIESVQKISAQVKSCKIERKENCIVVAMWQ